MTHRSFIHNVGEQQAPLSDARARHRACFIARNNAALKDNLTLALHTHLHCVAHGTALALCRTAPHMALIIVRRVVPSYNCKSASHCWETLRVRLTISKVQPMPQERTSDRIAKQETHIRAGAQEGSLTYAALY